MNKETAMMAVLVGLGLVSEGGQAGAPKKPQSEAEKKKELDAIKENYVGKYSKDRPMGAYHYEELCYGINECRAHTFCAVAPEEIEAANKHFNNKFKNSAPHACAAQGTCAAKEGVLGFTYVKKGTCIKVHKGFYIEYQDSKVPEVIDQVKPKKS